MFIYLNKLEVEANQYTNDRKVNLLQDDMTTTNSTAFRPVHLQELHWDYLNKATNQTLNTLQLDITVFVLNANVRTLMPVVLIYTLHTIVHEIVV